MCLRVIPHLSIKGRNLVKGIHLEGLRLLGKPERFIRLYFLSTRILAPLAGLEHTDPVSKELDSAARRLCQELDEPLLKGVGAQQLWLLAKV